MSEEDLYEVEADLGNLHLRVQGEDEDWVDETFDEKLDRLLDEAETISRALRDGDRGCQ